MPGLGHMRRPVATAKGMARYTCAWHRSSHGSWSRPHKWACPTQFRQQCFRRITADIAVQKQQKVVRLPCWYTAPGPSAHKLDMTETTSETAGSYGIPGSSLHQPTHIQQREGQVYPAPYHELVTGCIASRVSPIALDTWHGWSGGQLWPAMQNISPRPTAPAQPAVGITQPIPALRGHSKPRR